MSQIVAKHDASGKKVKLSCCKCVFDWIESPKSYVQNVQEMSFLQKAPGVNGLTYRKLNLFSISCRRIFHDLLVRNIKICVVI